MGPIEKNIHQKITEKYQPIIFDLENESHKHATALGSESHFRLVVVSSEFTEIKRIQRSRDVHTLLAEELKSIHALSLRLFSPQDWEKLENKESLLSPNCISKQ